MVIGQSRYFDLQASGSLETVTAKWELIRKDNDTVAKSASCPKVNNAHQIRVDTTGVSAGTYILRVTTTDSVDGFVDVAHSEKIELTK